MTSLYKSIQNYLYLSALLLVALHSHLSWSAIQMTSLKIKNTFGTFEISYMKLS